MSGTGNTRYYRRHCYDKPWRCPGWAGGGWTHTDVKRCDGGSLDIYNRPGRAAFGWRDHWRFSRCPKCGVRAIPYATRWLDPTYLAFRLKRLPGSVRDWRENCRWRRERRERRNR